MREISITGRAWQWLLGQAGGASGWIQHVTRDAMKADENAKLKELNFNQRAEIARLLDILNSLGVDEQRR